MYLRRSFLCVVYKILCKKKSIIVTLVKIEVYHSKLYRNWGE